VLDTISKMQPEDNKQQEEEHVMVPEEKPQEENQGFFKQRRRYFAAKTGSETKLEFQLIQSIYQNDEEAFDALISTFDNVSVPIGTGRSKWTPLMFAVHKKRTKIVAKLLAMGADPNCIDHSTKKSCLHTACISGYGGIARMLLQSGKIDNINYNGNVEGESPIYGAIKKCQKYCVELLLKYELHQQVCDINVALKTNKQTPMYIACDKGDIEMVRLLLNYKHMRCDLNSMDDKGYTPLMKAVGKRHVEIVKLLLNYGSEYGNNPLPIPNLNLVNKYKKCATMQACRTNNFKISKILLNIDENLEGGVLYRVDWRNRTLLDQCLQSHTDKRIIEYIKKLLYANIHSTIKSVNTSKDHENVPYLPSGVVQYICSMTY